MSQYDLTDFEWRVIEPLLPSKPRGVPRVDDCRLLNGIFWVLRSGAPWRDLPERYGPRATCYNRFVRWRKAFGREPAPGATETVICSPRCGCGSELMGLRPSATRGMLTPRCLCDIAHPEPAGVLRRNSSGGRWQRIQCAPVGRTIGG